MSQDYKEQYEELSRRLSRIRRVAQTLIHLDKETGLVKRPSLGVIGKQLYNHCLGYEADGKTKLT